MNTVGAREAEARFFALIEAAELGRPTTITRRGAPVAVIVPIAAARDLSCGDAVFR
jgi:prevent-host-death family protein